jgi:hypothetical protein
MQEGLFGSGSNTAKGPSVQLFGSNADVGRVGEDFYDRGLANAGIKEKYSVYRSRSIPASPGQREFGGDVDHLAANDAAVLLIDVKMWAGSEFYWSFNGIGFKGMLQPALREKEGQPKWPLSRNMEIAVERYTDALPSDIRVHGIVVFVPPTPQSVRFLNWPGGIRSYLADESYDVIERVLGEPSKAREDVDRLLRRWEKRD